MQQPTPPLSAFDAATAQPGQAFEERASREAAGRVSGAADEPAGRHGALSAAPGARQRRPFRVEIVERSRPLGAVGGPSIGGGLAGRPVLPDELVGDGLDRVMRELGEIKTMISAAGRIGAGRTGEADRLRATVDNDCPEEGMSSRTDPLKSALKANVEDIHQAIITTRAEIGALRAKGIATASNSRAKDELDAVVTDTEIATETILAAVEDIDRIATVFANDLADDYKEMANEISTRVVQILEACNFQDISGQRISKVVSLIHFIETKIAAMEAAWIKAGAFDPSAVEPIALAGEESLLNGPALKTDATVSQDEIDSLFS